MEDESSVLQDGNEAECRVRGSAFEWNVEEAGEVLEGKDVRGGVRECGAFERPCNAL